MVSVKRKDLTIAAKIIIARKRKMVILCKNIMALHINEKLLLSDKN